MLGEAVSSRFILVILRTLLSRSLEQASQQVDDAEGLGGPFYSGADSIHTGFRTPGVLGKSVKFFFVNKYISNKKLPKLKSG